MFDSAMNYDLRKHCMRFFGNSHVDAASFHERIVDMLYRYREQTVFAQLNLLDSHDVSRFLSVCGENADVMKAAVAFQMMMPGIPSVFYGDEQGISGVVEDDYRSPMPWKNMTEDFSGFYKRAIQVRKSEKAVRNGWYRKTHAEAGSYVYGFERYLDRESVHCIINMGTEPIEIAVAPSEILLDNNYCERFLKPHGVLIYK